MCEDGRSRPCSRASRPRGTAEDVDAAGRYVAAGLHRPARAALPAARVGALRDRDALGGARRRHDDHEDAPRPRRATTDGEFEAEIAGAESRAHVDFCFHLAVMTDGADRRDPGATRTLRHHVVQALHGLQGRGGHAIGIQGVDDGQLLDAFEAVAACGGVALVHCENQELAARAARAACSPEGRDGLRRASPTSGLDRRGGGRRGAPRSSPTPRAARSTSSTSRARQGTRPRSCAGARRRAASLRRDRAALPDRDRRLAGREPRQGASRRSAAGRRGGAAGRRCAGEVDTIGSDHVAATRARKQGSIWDAQLGFPGIATILPVLLSEGVHGRGLPLAAASSP